MFLIHNPKYIFYKVLNHGRVTTIFNNVKSNSPTSPIVIWMYILEGFRFIEEFDLHGLTNIERMLKAEGVDMLRALKNRAGR